jgi:hypothetical protein
VEAKVEVVTQVGVPEGSRAVVEGGLELVEAETAPGSEEGAAVQEMVIVEAAAQAEVVQEVAASAAEGMAGVAKEAASWAAAERAAAERVAGMGAGEEVGLHTVAA